MNANTKANEIHWEQLELGQDDLDFIYNYLLEAEKPMMAKELAKAIIQEKLRLFRLANEKQQKKQAPAYRPNQTWKFGEKICFPFLDNAEGAVIAVRDGKNPDEQPFQVIAVQFSDGSEKEFAAELQDHKLNTIDYLAMQSAESLDPAHIYKRYGRSLTKKVHTLLSTTKELYGLGDFWFPKALLSEVNPGFMNLAEAALEMGEGVPMLTREILEAIEYPMDSNQQLTEFSFNYALGKDDRFDEIGPEGVVLWTLKLLEPEDVRKRPLTLKYYEKEIDKDIDQYMHEKGLDLTKIHDELDENAIDECQIENDSFEICINYPHWKAGTLPLICDILTIFPTALETNKVIFQFKDIKTGHKFPGWVILSDGYVCGLKTWYRDNQVIPGSYILVARSEETGCVDVSLIPPRSSKDWIRTAIFDAKGKLHFETRQQNITTKFDERMCISIENTPQLDILWEQNNKKDINFKRLVEFVFKELLQENPQGLVHFSELYAAINFFHRCPPKPLMAFLLTQEKYNLMNDFYFKMAETESEKEVSL